MPKQNDAFPARLQGKISWWEGNEHDWNSHVSDCIFRSNDEISLQCSCGGYDYAGVLKRTSGCRFEGRIDRTYRGERSMVEASGTLYVIDNSYLLLGTWVEDGYEHGFVSKLDRPEGLQDKHR